MSHIELYMASVF